MKFIITNRPDKLLKVFVVRKFVYGKVSEKALVIACDSEYAASFMNTACKTEVSLAKARLLEVYSKKEVLMTIRRDDLLMTQTPRKYAFWNWSLRGWKVES